ncbi:MAG: glutaredoxin family protein [Planctomycetes bacterium]|nr:glutaredoxin family protein [Planctomycetota bacterium]
MHVRIYSRAACSLCDKVLDVVASAGERFPIEVEVVDIDRDPALKAEYDAEIPVVEVNDREIARYHLTLERLLRAIQANL